MCPSWPLLNPEKFVELLEEFRVNVDLVTLNDLLVGSGFHTHSLFVRQHRRIEGDRDFEGGSFSPTPPVAQG